MGSFMSHDSSIRVISKGTCKILHSSMHFQFSTRPMRAFFGRSFARRMFSETSETRAGAFILSRRRPRARAFRFLKPPFLISFRSFRLNTSRDDDGFHSNRNAFFVCTSTSRDPSKPTNRSRSRLGSGSRSRSRVDSFLFTFRRARHPSIHPSIHRASCVEGGTATATPTVMPPVMPRRRRRRRNGGGGTFRDGEDDGAGGVTRRTNA